MEPPSGAALVQRAFETFNREGIEAVIGLFALDFEVTVPPTMSAEPDTYRGPEGIRRWFAGFDGFMEDVRVELEELEEVDGDTVVAAMRLRARGTESGIEADQQLGQVVHLREGQVHRMEVFPTVEEARAAAAPGR